MRSERGFALLGVMLVVALLTVVVQELAVAMRLEASAGRSFREELLASIWRRRPCSRRCAKW
jgi:type II secretory pathway component PulK